MRAVITHNVLIGWLLAVATDAPPWRWLAHHQANAVLTVLRWSPGRLPAALVVNDVGHLPPELRWTGFPAELHV